MNKMRIYVNVEICEECKKDLSSIGQNHYNEYLLTCMHFSDNSIRCLPECSYNKFVIEELEKYGYLISTEHHEWIKIKPIGQIQKSPAHHIYCINKSHGT